MKILLLLLLFLVNRIFSTDLCGQNIKSITDFKPGQYFKGVWYLTAIEHTYSSDSEVCEQSYKEILPCANIIQQRFSVYLEYVKRFLHAESLTYLSDFDNSLATYTAVVKTLNKYTPYPNELELVSETIIATDYLHYGIVYTCSNNSVNYYVLKRNMYDETYDNDISKILTDNGLDYSKFKFRKNVHCPTDPDF